eukprot:TRINITY_DN47943_c0_g1_i1.p1 TRINITY_DN47943_c0_g1~~TRINITY_DN47943_c0_g1_i1.p1  ORF type:complete len:298 (-),score=40.29 TRINITY_DN47943_c0_g1_i1:221-1009(-)
MSAPEPILAIREDPPGPDDPGNGISELFSALFSSMTEQLSMCFVELVEFHQAEDDDDSVFLTTDETRLAVTCAAGSLAAASSWLVALSEWPGLLSVAFQNVPLPIDLILGTLAVTGIPGYFYTQVVFFRTSRRLPQERVEDVIYSNIVMFGGIAAVPFLLHASMHAQAFKSVLFIDSALVTSRALRLAHLISQSQDQIIETHVRSNSNSRFFYILILDDLLSALTGCSESKSYVASQAGSLCYATLVLAWTCHSLLYVPSFL